MSVYDGHDQPAEDNGALIADLDHLVAHGLAVYVIDADGEVRLAPTEPQARRKESLLSRMEALHARGDPHLYA